MPRAKKAKIHACVAFVNEKLAEQNAELAQVFGMTGSIYLAVTTCKIDSSKRGRVPMMVANHCPFCGKKFIDGTLRVKGEGTDAKNPTKKTKRQRR